MGRPNRKRRNLQLSVGGYGPKKHTEETKKKISKKVAGENNPSYGVPCSEERKRKISEKAKERYSNGFLSPTSVTYVLISPFEEKFEVFGELKKFCKSQNISYATMHSAILYNRKGPRKMDGALKRKFRISLPEDECVIKLQEYCGFSSILLKVPVVVKPLCADANCHNNVNHYTNTYGGKR